MLADLYALAGVDAGVSAAQVRHRARDRRRGDGCAAEEFNEQECARKGSVGGTGKDSGKPDPGQQRLRDPQWASQHRAKSRADHEQRRHLAPGQPPAEAHAGEDRLGQPGKRCYPQTGHRIGSKRKTQTEIIAPQQHRTNHDGHAGHCGAKRRVGNRGQYRLHMASHPHEQRRSRTKRDTGDADSERQPRVDMSSQLGANGVLVTQPADHPISSKGRRKRCDHGLVPQPTNRLDFQREHCSGDWDPEHRPKSARQRCNKQFAPMEPT